MFSRYPLLEAEPDLRLYRSIKFLLEAFERDAARDLAEETEDDQLLGLPPGDATAHQVEEVGGVHLPRGRAVGAPHVVGQDLEVRQRDRHRLVRPEDEVPVRLVGVGLLRPPLDPDEPAENGERLVPESALVQKIRVGVGGDVVLQRVVVEDLVRVGEVEPEHLRVAPRRREPRLDVRTAQLGAQRDHQAVYDGVPSGRGADGVEVQDVALPVLQGDVVYVRALPDEELDRAVAERGLLAAGRGVLVYVSDRGALLDHDESARHYGACDVEPAVALDRDLDGDPARHVKERPAGERRRAERRELVVAFRHQLEEALLDQILVLPESSVQVSEDDAFLLQLFIYTNKGRLGVVLDEQGRVRLALLYEPLDGVGEVTLPRHVGARGVGGEVLHPHVGDVRVAPRLVPQSGHRHLLEGAPRLEALLGEPRGLVLERRERLDGLDAYALILEDLRHPVRAHISPFSRLEKGADP